MGKTLLTKGNKKKTQYRYKDTTDGLKTEGRKFSDTQVPAKTGSKLIQGEKPVKINGASSDYRLPAGPGPARTKPNPVSGLRFLGSPEIILKRMCLSRC